MMGSAKQDEAWVPKLCQNANSHGGFLTVSLSMSSSARAGAGPLCLETALDAATELDLGLSSGTLPSPWHAGTLHLHAIAAAQADTLQDPALESNREELPDANKTVR